MRLAVLAVVLLAAAPARAQWSPAPAPVRATHGMVVSAERHASEAGVAVMRAGGNAVDAAVATGFALAVTFPVAGNIGGGGFMVPACPTGRATTLDFRETAPAAATRDMFLDADGHVRAARAATRAPRRRRAGLVAGLLERARPLGKAAARRRARAGDRARRARLRALARRAPLASRLRRDLLARFPSTAPLFAPADAPLAEGERGPAARPRRGPAPHPRPGARRLLRRRDGAPARGRDAARRRPHHARRPRRLPGRRARARRRDVPRQPRPLDAAAVVGRRSRSLQLLASVEPVDVGALGFNSSASVHLMAEAMRRAFADRAEWLGDPAFVRVPVAGLLDSAYVAARMASIDPDARHAAGRHVRRRRATSPTRPRTTRSSTPTAWPSRSRRRSTAPTGCPRRRRGAGFLLNNEMDDFAAAPGVPNQFGLVGTRPTRSARASGCSRP